MKNLATNQMTSIPPPSEPALISGGWLCRRWRPRRSHRKHWVQ